MKKIYALLSVMALTALTAAAVPVKSPVLQKANAEAVGAKKQKAPVAKAAPTGEYKSLGMGTYTDDMVLTLFTGMKPATYQVEIRQSVEDPNYYQVVAPYGANFIAEATAQFGSTISEDMYDSAGTKILTLDATDPNNVTFSEFATGCDFGYGEMSIGIIAENNLTFKDGVFTAPKKGLYITDNDGSYYANNNGAFRIALPGVKVKDYTLDLTLESQCLTDRKLTGSLKAGADIATVKAYTTTLADESRIEDEIETIASVGTTIEADIYKNFVVTMTEGNTKETIVFVGLDEAGKVQNFVYATYYDVTDDPDQWEDCGNVTFTADFLGTLYSVEKETLTVPFQRNKNDFTRLRLVNPYANSAYKDYNEHTGAHNHFITLNVADPEFIYLEDSPIGFDLGNKMVCLWSYAGYGVAEGYTKEQVIGSNIPVPTFDEATNTIKFPSKSLLISTMEYTSSGWYTVSSMNNAIKFPAGFNVFGGVDDITVDADAAPARYYNLQGVSVANPVAGQLYIRVQGDKATKIVY